MLDRTARQINDTDRDQGGQQPADERLVEATVVRALCTERQLYEVMVEFWANHFSIHTPSGDRWGRRTVADREVYRPNALGRFADLLVASAKDSAMLRYLNNEDSCYRGDESAVQDNYGRELLELHTVGVDAARTADGPVERWFPGDRARRRAHRPPQPQPLRGDALMETAGSGTGILDRYMQLRTERTAFASVAMEGKLPTSMAGPAAELALAPASRPSASMGSIPMISRVSSARCTTRWTFPRGHRSRRPCRRWTPPRSWRMPSTPPPMVRNTRTAGWPQAA